MNSLNLFQWISLSILLALLIYELSLAIRHRTHRGFWVLRVSIWIATGLAIYRPDVLTRLASLVGIQRGADLVLYLAVLFFVGATLYLYAKCLRLQKQITQIVRHLAIDEPREPDRG